MPRGSNTLSQRAAHRPTQLARRRRAWPAGGNGARLPVSDESPVGQDAAAERVAVRLLAAAIADDLWGRWIEGSPQDDHGGEMGRGLAANGRRAVRRVSIRGQRVAKVN